MLKGYTRKIEIINNLYTDALDLHMQNIHYGNTLGSCDRNLISNSQLIISFSDSNLSTTSLLCCTKRCLPESTKQTFLPNICFSLEFLMCVNVFKFTNVENTYSVCSYLGLDGSGSCWLNFLFVDVCRWCTAASCLIDTILYAQLLNQKYDVLRLPNHLYPYLIDINLLFGLL